MCWFVQCDIIFPFALQYFALHGMFALMFYLSTNVIRHFTLIIEILKNF